MNPQVNILANVGKAFTGFTGADVRHLILILFQHRFPQSGVPHVALLVRLSWEIIGKSVDRGTWDARQHIEIDHGAHMRRKQVGRREKSSFGFNKMSSNVKMCLLAVSKNDESLVKYTRRSVFCLKVDYANESIFEKCKLMRFGYGNGIFTFLLLSFFMDLFHRAVVVLVWKYALLWLPGNIFQFKRTWIKMKERAHMFDDWFAYWQLSPYFMTKVPYFLNNNVLCSIYSKEFYRLKINFSGD